MLLGRDKQTDERVSVFVLDKRLLGNGRKFLLTRRDAGIIRSTQTHKSILRVIDVFETTRVVHMVTELTTGGSLQSFLLGNLPLSDVVVKRIAQDLLGALAHLHRLGMVHGSVCAENAVIARRKTGDEATPELGVKLCVFGLASYKHEGDLDGSGLGCRSRETQGRAPEVVCFQQRSSASDVFECGTMIFTLLTGVAAFGGRTEAEYLSRVSLGASGPAWARLPHDAYDLLHGMLQDEPARRPAANECLAHGWFARADAEVGDGGRCEADGGDRKEGDGAHTKTDSACGQDASELARFASDPKTVIVDFDAKSGKSGSRSD